MDNQDLRKLYLTQIEDYCNVIFNEPYPAGIELALDTLCKLDPLQFAIASESLSDMSTTYATPTNGSGIPDFIISWIDPYRRPFIVSNKKKKVYNDGRR